jgi:hypothetical protein
MSGVSVAQEFTEQLPVFAVEARELHLPDRMTVLSGGVDSRSRQDHQLRLKRKNQPALRWRSQRKHTTPQLFAGESRGLMIRVHNAAPQARGVIASAAF